MPRAKKKEPKLNRVTPKPKKSVAPKISSKNKKDDSEDKTVQELPSRSRRAAANKPKAWESWIPNSRDSSFGKHSAQGSPAYTKPSENQTSDKEDASRPTSRARSRTTAKKPSPDTSASKEVPKSGIEAVSSENCSGGGGKASKRKRERSQKKDSPAAVNESSKRALYAPATTSNSLGGGGRSAAAGAIPSAAAHALSAATASCCACCLGNIVGETPQPTPHWQKPITSFLLRDPNAPPSKRSHDNGGEDGGEENEPPMKKRRGEAEVRIIKNYYYNNTCTVL